MKLRAGQAGKICLEAMHQLGRIVLLLCALALTALGLFAYSLSRHPMQVPQLTSWLATKASGNGINVRVDKAELAWAGYHQGGGVPFVLRLSGIEVRSAAGALLVDVPQADAVVPPADLLGGRGPILLRASAARIAGNEAPVTIRANIWPGHGFTLARGMFFVSIGAGQFRAGGASLPISAAGFTLRVVPGDIEVTDGTLDFAQIGGSAPHVTFSFAAHRTQGWAGQLDASLDAVRAQEIGHYWPPRALPSARDWVLAHITKGTAEHAKYTFTLAAPGDLAGLKLTNAVGGFDGEGLTLYWLTGGVPLTGLNGHFAMPDKGHAIITATSGQVDKVRLRQGRMDIFGMDQKEQTSQLELDLTGAVPDVLAVLDAPPWSLLTHAPPQLATATGQVEGHVSATIPFVPDLTFGQMKLNVTAQITDAAMPDVLSGLGLRQGAVQLQTDGHRLALQAKAEFTGQPLTLTLHEEFAGAGKQDLLVNGTAGAPFWHYLGLDTASGLYGPVTGTAPFALHITGTATGAQTATLQASLGQTNLSLPIFGWSKVPGQAGQVNLTASLRDGVFVAAQSIAVTAPGLSVAGAQQGNSMVFSSVAIGNSRAAGRLSWPAQPGGRWQADFTGPVLDVRQPKPAAQAPATAPLAQPAPAGAAPAQPAGARWALHLGFTQLGVAAPPAPVLSGFSLTASGQGGIVQQAQGAAQGVSFSVAPSGQGRYNLLVQAEDAGLLLRSMGEYDHMQGGQLTLNAEYGGSQPVQGKATLVEARFENAPEVTKLLEALTVYGVADAASGPGLKISHAEIPFSLQNSVLTLYGARAWSSSLGFTASGDFNLADNTCDVEATIVPAYAVNSLPGKIPLLGRLFAPEKGGGLLAMRAHITGPISNVNVRMNPLSALTPGFLRSIFGLGDVVKGKEKTH